MSLMQSESRIAPRFSTRQKASARPIPNFAENYTQSAHNQYMTVLRMKHENGQALSTVPSRNPFAERILTSNLNVMRILHQTFSVTCSTRGT